MEKFVIEGGVPLAGTIVPAGNKNGALPILAACLLTDDEVILRNVPRISDVEAMVLLLESLGASVRWLGDGEVSINTASVESQEVDRGFAERIRASFLLAGPLLARFGRAYMPPPGATSSAAAGSIRISTRSAPSAQPSNMASTSSSRRPQQA